MCLKRTHVLNEIINHHILLPSSNFERSLVDDLKIVSQTISMK